MRLMSLPVSQMLGGLPVIPISFTAGLGTAQRPLCLNQHRCIQPQPLLVTCSEIPCECTLCTAPTALTGHLLQQVISGSLNTISQAFVALVPLVNPSIQILGSGTTRFPENLVAPLSIPGGRLRPGGICIAPANGLISPPPGTAGWPLPGITPLLVDESGQPLESRGDAGHLCIKYPWLGQARTVYGDHTRFFDTYFSQYPGHYFTGDGAIVDGHDQIKIVGRVDDVLNVSGHRIATAELESTIIEVEGISEVAVVGLPHEIKGEGICAFVCSSLSPDSLLTQINQALRASIGAHAKLDELYRISALPKTRSGKCMRRVLRRLALDPRASLGDLSTLADPAVVEDIRRDLSRI